MTLEENIHHGTIRQITLEKRGESFIFRYHPGQENELLDCLAELATNPNSIFDWYDAAVLSYQAGRKMEPYLKP